MVGGLQPIRQGLLGRWLGDTARRAVPCLPACAVVAARHSPAPPAFLRGLSTLACYPPSSLLQYLTLLLAAPDRGVLLATLQALVAFVRKAHGTTLRWAASEELSARLRALAASWGLRDEGLGLLGCATGGQGATVGGRQRRRLRRIGSWSAGTVGCEPGLHAAGMQ